MELELVRPAMRETLSELSATAGNNQYHTTATRYCAVAQVGHRIYVTGKIGVQRLGDTTFAVIAVLDIVRSEWTWIRRRGPGYQEGCIFLLADGLYWFGPGDWQNSRSGDMSRFDLATEEWAFCHSTGQMPEHRRCFSGHFMEERWQFILFGGQKLNYTAQNDVYLMDLPQCHWVKPTVKGRAPTERWQHGSCVYNGVFYCYGGWSPGGRSREGLFLLHFVGKHSVVWSNPQTNAETVGPLSSFALVPWRGSLYLCGGVNYEGDQKITQYDVEKRTFSALEAAVGNDLSLGFGTVGISIDGGRAVALFGGQNDVQAYLRLTALGETGA